MVIAFAIIGVLAVVAVLIRLSGFKGFYLGLEFHDKPKQISQSSKLGLENVKASQLVDRARKLID